MNSYCIIVDNELVNHILLAKPANVDGNLTVNGSSYRIDNFTVYYTGWSIYHWTINATLPNVHEWYEKIKKEFIDSCRQRIHSPLWMFSMKNKELNTAIVLSLDLELMLIVSYKWQEKLY